MKQRKPLLFPASVFGALALAMSAGLTSCGNDGPLEEAGEAIDDAAEDAGDAVEDVVEEIDN